MGYMVFRDSNDCGIVDRGSMGVVADNWKNIQ
jgi:hypothetical protein